MGRGCADRHAHVHIRISLSLGPGLQGGIQEGFQDLIDDTPHTNTNTTLYEDPHAGIFVEASPSSNTYTHSVDPKRCPHTM